MAEVTCWAAGKSSNFFERATASSSSLAIQTSTTRRSTNTALRLSSSLFLCATHSLGRSSRFHNLCLSSIARIAAPQPGFTTAPNPRPLSQWITREIPAPGLRCPTLVAHSVWEYVAPYPSLLSSRLERNANSANKILSNRR